MRYTINIFILFLLTVSLHAQVSDSDDLIVKIAVFGPGDKIYAWWGHITLIIDDKNTGRSTSYDFGIFSDENRFFKNIISGRLIYTCEALPAKNNINWYIDLHCDVTLYTLNLAPDKKEEIRQLAEISVLPENRDYFYRFLRDNCTTRIRDIIDIAAGGQFMERFINETSRYTLRQHVRRHTWFSPFIDWVFGFFIGRDNDRKVTVWEAMFLPSELENCINSFFYTDEHGIPRKLVSDIEIVYRPQNNFAVPVPRKLWPQGFAASIITAFILVLLLLAQAKPPAAQLTLGIVHSLFGLLFGGTGLLLFFMSFFTDHDYTYHNINLLFCNPLLLAAVPFGIMYAATTENKKRLFAELSLRTIWFLVILGLIISILIKLLPMFRQENFKYQIVMLPIAVALSLGTSGLKKVMQCIFQLIT